MDDQKTFATAAVRKNGQWVGTDGSLSPDDVQALNMAHRQPIDAAIEHLKAQPVERPQTYADFTAAKDHLRAIRELTELRDTFND